VQVGHDLLERVIKRLAEIAKPESRAQMEGRMLSMILSPDRAAIKKLEARRAAEAAKLAKAEEAAAAAAGVEYKPAEPQPEEDFSAALEHDDDEGDEEETGDAQGED
jgi:hypothetical protein